jgi:hypothetical protein
MRSALHIKRRLADAWALVRALGLDEGAVRQARGLLCRCPWHAERTASCSVTLADDGLLRVRCFGCGASGDALSLIAAARGLDARADFRRVLDEAEAILGEAATGPPPPPPPRPAYVRPPPAELETIWAACGPFAVTQVAPDPLDLAVTWFCARRRWWPAAVDQLDMVRVTPLPATLPTWPAWWPASWATRWRIAILAYEPDGRPASLHARAVIPETVPKTRWPYRCQSAGLLFADRRGVEILRGQAPPGLESIVVTEGLTDTIAAALVVQETGAPMAVLGAASGGFAAFADVRWPEGCPAIVAVDADGAGERYLAELQHALPAVELRRWRPPPSGESA